MKRKYTKPTIEVSTAYYELCLLAASVYTPRDREYHCPYAPSLYCRDYSEHMNNWRRSVEDAAQNGRKNTFYTREGCIYEKTCEVYKLYMFKKQHENGGK